MIVLTDMSSRLGREPWVSATDRSRLGHPWQNGHVERLIGTLRRECLDRVLIFGEAHLRRILFAYAAYYNQTRTHLALQKDAPLHRVVQRSGVIVAIPILAGLHHQYVRI
jgi:Integrase core domain